MTDVLIASHGASASAWLAMLLQSHPDIYCVHGSAMRPVKGTGDFDITAIRANSGMAGLLQVAQATRRGAQTRTARALSSAFTELRTHTNAPICAMVHSYRLRDVPTLPSGTTTAPIQLFNLVRHPVDVVHSAHGLLRQSMRIDLHELWWSTGRLVADHLERIETLAAQYDLFPGDIEVVSFFVACLALEGLAADLSALAEVQQNSEFIWHRHLKCEDLIGSAQARADLLSGIGADPRAATVPPRINTHAPTDRPQSPEDKWHIWTDWQRRAYTDFFQETNLRTPYQQMGYDCSMIPDA